MHLDKKSKMIVQHSFRPSAFKELRENVSITTLEKLVDEMKRDGFIGIDSFACRCQLRHIHGLSCAHEITNHSRQGHPITLDSVHPYWRKLDMQPTLNQNHASEDDVPSEDLNLFKQVYT